MHIEATIGSIINLNASSRMRRTPWPIIQWTLIRLLLSMVTLTTLQTLAVASDNQWELVWSDEFQSDNNKVDTNKWAYEEGFLRNEEAQYYTRSERNVAVSDGKLIITARQETLPNKDYWKDAPNGSKWVMTRKTSRYTSGSISTEGKFSFTYGRVDVRARLPSGNGTWPAIWLIGASLPEIGWPGCGEIDVMEHLGRQPGHIYASIHYQGADDQTVMRNNKLATESAATEYHVYTLIWSREAIIVMMDDHPYFEVSYSDLPPFQNGENPFQRPFSIKLNLALGGEWAGAVDSGILPQQFIIDYVRVYKKKSH